MKKKPGFYISNQCNEVIKNLNKFKINHNKEIFLVVVVHSSLFLLLSLSLHTHTHAHTHTYIYIYIYIYEEVEITLIRVHGVWWMSASDYYISEKNHSKQVALNRGFSNLTQHVMSLIRSTLYLWIYPIITIYIYICVCVCVCVFIDIYIYVYVCVWKRNKSFW